MYKKVTKMYKKLNVFYSFLNLIFIFNYKNFKNTFLSERSRTWANVGTFTNVHEPSRTSFMKDVMNAHDCILESIRTRAY